MYTVCPKCSLTLVVTAADLRVAQGYVRCGRCSNVFNALNALSDERAPDANAPPRPETPTVLSGPDILPPPDEPDAEPAPIAEPEPRAEAAVAEADDPDAELEFDPTSTRVEEIFLAPPGEGDETTGTFEAIVLGGDEGEEEEEEAEEDIVEIDTPQSTADPDSELDEALQSLAQRIELQNQPVAQDLSPRAPDISPSTAETLQELGIGGEPRLAEEDEEESGVRLWAWRGALAALVLLLTVQTIHHYRRELAVVPQLTAPLTAVYDALGVTLEPRWDVAAYEVHQLGATTDPEAAARLIVRASIKNVAPRPQPLPLLRVAVQDRFGNRIASSDVTPASYAPRVRPQARLGRGQRIDVEMRFVDPGSEAVGFEIDACLAAPTGAVNCANH